MENIFANAFTCVLLPFIAGILIILGLFKNNTVIIRRFATYFNAGYFLYTLLLFLNFNTADELNYAYTLPKLVGYTFASDTPGTFFVATMSFIVLICFIFAKSALKSRHKLFYTYALFFEGAFVGILYAQDFLVLICALLFETFCAYMLISNFKSQRYDAKSKKAPREYISANIFAIFLLICALSVVFAAFTKNGIEPDIINIANYGSELSFTLQIIVFLGFLIIAAFKIPFLGFHKPLLNIIDSSNHAISMVFLGEILLGFFIFIKFNMYSLNGAFSVLTPAVATLAAISICYFGALSIYNSDLKKSFAYFCFLQSSISLIALTSTSSQGIYGAIFQCASQSLILLGLFLSYSLVIKIFKTAKLPFMGALATKAPELCAFGFILTLAAIDMPLTSGFVAKFLCILGSFSVETYSADIIRLNAFVMLLGFILSTVYLIKVFQNIFFGADKNPIDSEALLKPLRHQKAGLFAVTAVIIFLGVAPYYVTTIISKYADMILSVFLP